MYELISGITARNMDLQYNYCIPGVKSTSRQNYLSAILYDGMSPQDLRTTPIWLLFTVARRKHS